MSGGNLSSIFPLIAKPNHTRYQDLTTTNRFTAIFSFGVKDFVASTRGVMLEIRRA